MFETQCEGGGMPFLHGEAPSFRVNPILAFRAPSAGAEHLSQTSARTCWGAAYQPPSPSSQTSRHYPCGDHQGHLTVSLPPFISYWDSCLPRVTSHPTARTLGAQDPGPARGHVSCVGPCTGDSAGFDALTCHLELLNELSRGPVFSLHTES